MSAVKFLAAWIIFSLSASAVAARADAISLSHYESLQRLSVTTADGGGSRKLSAAGPVDLSFDALGRTYELRLSPNSNLLAAAREAGANDIIPYRGQLAGVPDSWARIVIAGGEPAGLIWDGSELLAIESSRDNIAGANSTIIYRLADAVIAAGSMTCGSDGASTDGATVYKSLLRELGAVVARAQGAVSEITVGAVGDFEFFGIHGLNSDAEILTRLSNVDGVFSRDVGVQIDVPVIETFTDANDPFTATDASLLLDEVADYREGSATQNANGLTHLWTGKDLDGSTVGIAFTSTIGTGGFLALCDQRFGAGLSEGSNGPTFDGMVAAHEIGHNFGAPHDGEPMSPCESETGNFLMSTSLNPSMTQNQFSQCSIDQMSDDVAQALAAGCIMPLPSVDMRIRLAGQDPTILLGNTATVTFDVSNAGTLQATNVAADITLPTNISLISAAASMGSCTDGGGVVNCSIGAVDGTSTVTVTLTSDTTAVGIGTFDATVTADVDDNTTNNEDSVVLTVQPAVNLLVNAPPASQVNVDQSTTISAVLENTSIMDATGVTLTIGLSAGLRADSASWPIGTCTVTASQVDCLATAFAAQSTATLTLGVTALSGGAKNVNVAVSSIEADADPSNNSVDATVNVRTAGEDSGGGAPGPVLLLLLGLVAVFGRNRALGRAPTERS